MIAGTMSGGGQGKAVGGTPTALLFLSRNGRGGQCMVPATTAAAPAWACARGQRWVATEEAQGS
jgi:hypothetical protein